jgi:uncharacterized protein YcbX
MQTGTVSRLWRWPVKSMAGEEVRALSIGEHGAGGDRVHAVLHEHKGEWRPLTAREAPGLLAWTAAYPFDLDAGLDPAEPPHAMVSQPGGRRTWRWGDPQLRSALERDLDRPVRLHRDVAGIPDVPGQMLLTTGATLRALSSELGAEVDLRRFRPNLHLELDAEPWAEAGWAGAVVTVEGGVRLAITQSCERCAIPTRDPDTREKWPGLLRHLAAEHEQNLGVLARVLAGGRVAAGAQVRVEPA